MKAWCEAPYYVSGVVYNHVAVNTMGVRSGIAGSISAPIVAWQPQTYTNTVTTLASHAQKIIQDKSRLHAVAMLINTETDEVVNAAQSEILPYGASGIKDFDHSPSTVDHYYDVLGRRVLTPERGIYIKNGKIYIAQ